MSSSEAAFCRRIAFAAAGVALMLAQISLVAVAQTLRAKAQIRIADSRRIVAISESPPEWLIQLLLGEGNVGCRALVRENLACDEHVRRGEDAEVRRAFYREEPDHRIRRSP
jgi:hypothetical protein